MGIFSFDSGVPGPRVVSFGGVHGDEISGVRAIERLAGEFSSGVKKLLKGNLVLAIANKEAVKQGKRYAKHNLNRLFKDKYDDSIDVRSYEYFRTQELKVLLQQCDYFFDLHSAPIAQDPFIIVESPYVGLFSKLGIQKLITGWGKFSEGPIGGDAENYANQHGAWSATLESGSHFDPESIEIAYRSLVLFLIELGLISATVLPQKRGQTVEIFDMYKVQTKNFEDFAYDGDMKNFTYIPAGESYAHENGSPLVVAEDSYVLVPMKPEEIRIGEEICYLGRKIK